ncbi:MAG: HAD-IIIA family hydrolase [Bacteroidota bacterium]
MLSPSTYTTLFLDRDGVINRRLPGRYVRSWSQFEFLPGVLEALCQLRPLFQRMVVVTNQLGVHKGLITAEDVRDVHRQMSAAIEQAGAVIDGIYFCPDRSDCRKPASGMALSAQREFPEVDFRHSIMIGDSVSDMQFGQALGMYTVLIPSKEEEKDAYAALQVDERVDGLAQFAHQWLAKSKRSIL